MLQIVETHVKQKLAELAVRTAEELEMDLEKQEKTVELAARVRTYVLIADDIHYITTLGWFNQLLIESNWKTKHLAYSTDISIIGSFENTY